MRCLWLPVLYAYFTIPVWDLLNPLLQWLSAFAVRGVLSLIGLPVYFDGLHFQIPAGVFEIAGGCSGLHFFIVGAAIAVFYGELHRDRLATRVKLVALAIADGDAHQLVAHRHYHYCRPPDRHAPLPGERRALHVRLGDVRRGDGYLLPDRASLGCGSPGGAPAPAPAASVAPRRRGAGLRSRWFCPGCGSGWTPTAQRRKTPPATTLPSEVTGWRALAPRGEPRPAEFINADGFAARAVQWRR